MKRQTWDQVKNITSKELINALLKDRWMCDVHGTSAHIFKKGSKRVSVHHHSGKTYGPKMLKNLFNSIGWSDADLKRLKLAK